MSHISGGKKILGQGIINTKTLKWEMRPGIFQEHQRDKYGTGKEGGGGEVILQE